MQPTPSSQKDRRTVFDALKPSKSIEKPRPSSRASPSTPARPAGSSFVACPLCERPIHYKLIESHAATCTGLTDQPTDQPTPPNPPEPHPSPAATPQPTQQPSQDASQAVPDALRVLMVNQQARSQVYHFYLHWSEEHGWRWVWLGQAQWSSPEGAALREAVVWQASMQLPANIHAVADKHAAPHKPTLTLSTNLAMAAGGPVSHNVVNMASSRPSMLGRCHIGTALGKSALQKNIRCALQLMKDDMDAFIRRIVVICLEDTVLHPALPLLVWLTCATGKGYELGATAGAACLSIVAQMARVGVRDALPDPPPPHTTLTAVERDVLEGHLTPLGGMLVRCLLVRAAFGGMPGDVRMLKALFAALPSTEYAAYAVQAVELLDVPLSAVDFHVCGIVDELAGTPAVQAAAASCLEKADPDHASVTSLLQRCMWRYRSSTNRRACWTDEEHAEQVADERQEPPVPSCEQERRFWEAVLPLVDAWATKYLRSRFF